MSEAGTMADFKIFSTVEELRSVENEWNALHRKANGTVFQTFGWNITWWEIYRQPNYELRVTAFYHGSEMIGILPLFRETVHLGFCTFSRLRFIGVYETYGEYTPLVHRGYEAEVLSGMAGFSAAQFSGNQCDLISLFRFSPDSPLMRRYMETMEGENFSVRYQPECIVRIVMELPESWEGYLSSLSGTEKKLLQRRSRALLKLGAETERIDNPALTGKDFDDFVSLHTAAWSGKGIPGYYESERFERFHRTVTTRLTGSGTSRLYFLKKNGIRFAAVQAFFVNDTCCFYLSGMDRHHQLSNQSPGKVLLSIVIGDAISEKMRYFDFQGGDEEYKFRLGGTETSFSKVDIWKKGPGTLKVYGFLFLQYARRLVLDRMLENRFVRMMRKLKQAVIPGGGDR